MAFVKYIVFFLFLACGVPVASILAKRNKYVRYTILFTMVYFTSYMVDINFVSREGYRGTSRGFEYGLVDMTILVGITLVLNDKKKYPVRKWPPGSTLYLMYWIFSAMSIVNAEVVLYSAFELFKMIRVYTFLWVIYNLVNEPEDLARFVRFISVIVIMIFFTVLKQKYLMGIFQCMGPFPHQNSLVMYLVIFMTLIFSYLLSAQSTSSMFYWLFVFGAGMLCIVSTLSRAGMAVTSFSVLIVLVTHVSWKLNGRKIAIMFMMALGAAGVILKSMDSIKERFENAPEESANTRVVLAIAACNMADDKILGVGLNHFGMKVNPPWRYGEHIEMPEGEDAVLVETIYLMIASETGWHNLAIFLIMLIFFYIMNIVNIFKSKNAILKTVSIGFLGGLTGVYLESALEWVLKQTCNSYQLMFVFGAIGAIYKINKRQKLQEKQAKRLACARAAQAAMRRQVQASLTRQS